MICFKTSATFRLSGNTLIQVWPDSGRGAHLSWGSQAGLQGFPKETGDHDDGGHYQLII